MTWSTRLQRRRSDRVHARGDAVAKQATPEPRGRFGFGAHVYRDLLVRPVASRGKRDRPAHRSVPVGTLIAVYDSDGCQGRCDAKCYDAHEPDHECICGGRSHGAGQQAIGGETPRAPRRRTL